MRFGQGKTALETTIRSRTIAIARLRSSSGNPRLLGIPRFPDAKPIGPHRP
jgi:hypothetical protein